MKHILNKTAPAVLAGVLTALAVFAAACDNPSGGEKARYGISLSVTGTHPFAAAIGYAAGDISPLTVTVSNAGDQPTGALAVNLSGANPGSFTLSAATIADIPASGTGTFSVGPNTGLGEGSYAATVTVSGGNGIAPQSFGVSFTVMEPLNSIAGVSSYLSGVSGGTAANPVPLLVSLNLADTGGNGWAALLSAIQSARKYVALDLSASDISGMTATAGEFDPGAANTGERYVVSLVLPDGATGVKEGAFFNSTFRNFTALKSVAGAGVTSVGDRAFYDCTSLTTVSLPEATSIGGWAFSDCTGLTSVSLPEAESFGVFAFSGCTGLGSVSLPAGLTSIGGGAFQVCTALTDITVDSGNPSYRAENGMLLSKDGKTLIAYPSAAGALTLDGITSVGGWAFGGCAGLTSLSFPEAESVGGGAFQLCTALTSVSLPEATSIDISAFAHCRGLTSVSLPEATSVGSSAFWDCTALTSVSLPKAASIYYNTFDGCTALTSVSLPKATSIGAFAFAFASTGTRALTVTLGNTVPALGYGMFYEVTSTKAVTVRVPSGAAAWSGIISGSPYNETGPYTDNWGNGFRGGGWNGSAMTSNVDNSNITLTVEEYTP